MKKRRSVRPPEKPLTSHYSFDDIKAFDAFLADDKVGSKILRDLRKDLQSHGKVDVIFVVSSPHNSGCKELTVKTRKKKAK